MEKNNTFGEFVREQRTSLGMTLREFCLKNKIDCVVLSKIERGIQLPKRNELRKLGRALKLLDDTAEHREYLKLFQEFEKAPYEFSYDQLPVFLPPNITDEQILKLIDSVKNDSKPSEKELFY